jgi:hypothetical protein
LLRSLALILVCVHDRKSKAVAPVVYTEASALVERWKDVVRAARNADSPSDSERSQAEQQPRRRGGGAADAPPAAKKRKAAGAAAEPVTSRRGASFCLFGGGILL